jgi:L(+)-tartrate dehydratase alpha subunit
MTVASEPARVAAAAVVPRIVPIGALEEAALEIMRRAAIDIPDDYKDGIRRMLEEEEEELSRFVLEAMLENWDAASADRRAMCADTGLPRFFVKCGNQAFAEGGFCNLERTLRRATARATREMPLRPNRVHPLTRHDHNNNVGIRAPEIEYSFEPEADWIELTTVHKGGLFGTDYRMLFPGDGIEGIKRFFLDVMVQFGRRGLACQPAIVGVGLGGSKDTAMSIGKQAACLRAVGSRNPDPEVASLEDELKTLGNTIGMGPMGFVGKSMVVGCHVEVAHTHTGGMPMSVHAFCLSSRRATARVHPDGAIAYRSDPVWFTDYMRREGVE